jgi:hypothetical protein
MSGSPMVGLEKTTVADESLLTESREPMRENERT